MKAANNILTMAVGGAVLVTVATLVWPLTIPSNSSWLQVHYPLAVTSALACFYVGAALLFTWGLGVYTAKLRLSYSAIVLGIVLTAFGTVQLPVISAFGLGNTFWASSGMILTPFLLSNLMTYLGARGFARLVGIRSPLTNVGIVLPSVVVLTGFSIFLPHGPIAISELTYDITNALLVWTASLSLSAALVMYQIKQHIGGHYTKAASWLFIALLGGFLIVAASLVYTFTFGANSVLVDNILDTITIAVSIAYMRAGFEFIKTREL